MNKQEKAELTMLRDQVRYWKDLAEAKIPKYSDVKFWQIYPRDHIQLPIGSTVRFVLGDETMREYVDVRIDRNENIISIMGGDRLQIFPQISNVIGLRIGKVR